MRDDYEDFDGPCDWCGQEEEPFRMALYDEEDPDSDYIMLCDECYTKWLDQCDRDRVRTCLSKGWR